MINELINTLENSDMYFYLPQGDICIELKITRTEPIMNYDIFRNEQIGLRIWMDKNSVDIWYDDHIRKVKKPKNFTEEFNMCFKITDAEDLHYFYIGSM